MVTFRGLFTSLLIVMLCSGLLAGCASTPPINKISADFDEIINYAASLPAGHPDSVEQVFFIPDDLKQQILSQIRIGNRDRAAIKLAMWLVDSDGLNMQYDIAANLRPAQALVERRGNCLSFTLLLMELANQIGIRMRVNQVDLPNMWGQDERRDLVFYRHVNAIYKTAYRTQIFDLAIQEYREGYPQKVVTRHQAAGLLFSNIGIQLLQSAEPNEAERQDKAFHYLKLSASLFPENADMWINLAAAYKRQDNLEMAEKAYLYAFSISDKNSLAASNLERLYRWQGKKSKAERFRKLAVRAREHNPYVLYRRAENAFADKRYKVAAKSIKRAIYLHNKDAQFFELSSRIKQVSNKYVSALKDLEKAHNLSTNYLERGRYAYKVERVVERAKLLAAERAEKTKNRREYRIENPQIYDRINSY